MKPTGTTTHDSLSVRGEILAQALGVSGPRIRQLAEAGIVIRTGRNRYDLIGSVRRVRDLEKENGNGNGKTPTTGEARAKYWLSKAELTEFQLRQRRGELIPADQVTAVWTRLAGNFRSRILAAPTKLASVLVGVTDRAAIADKIQEELYAALEELSSEGNVQTFVKDLEKDPPQGNGAEAKE